MDGWMDGWMDGSSSMIGHLDLLKWRLRFFTAMLVFSAAVAFDCLAVASCSSSTRNLQRRLRFAFEFPSIPPSISLLISNRISVPPTPPSLPPLLNPVRRVNLREILNCIDSTSKHRSSSFQPSAEGREKGIVRSKTD